MKSISFLVLISIMCQSSFADNIILTIDGNISLPNNKNSIQLSLDDLKNMPATHISTNTSWTNGLQRFKGVTMEYLLNKVNSKGSSIKAIALNDYAVEIPISDFKKYPVIIAYQRNGEYMTVRNKGPLWIIYPETDFPNINSLKMKERWLWQLRTITVN